MLLTFETSNYVSSKIAPRLCETEIETETTFLSFLSVKLLAVIQNKQAVLLTSAACNFFLHGRLPSLGFCCGQET